MKAISSIILVALIVSALGCLSQTPQPTPSPPAEVCFSTGDCVTVEIADEPAETSRGLMFRQKLGADEGMLFIFPSEVVQKFWMKNTLIPLDMLWITENGKIIFIEHDVPPCKSDPCPTYGPDEPAKYVLEVNAGYIKEHGLKVGDTLKLP
ncbi:MAG: DUF192 domain-containing protein [Candidatus Altiarchaeota archaeon]